MTQPIDPDALVHHLDGLRHLARHLVWDDHEADDILQDAAVAALTTDASPRRGLGAWLTGVTRNKARRLARSSSRRRRHEHAAAVPEEVPATEDLAIRAAEQSRVLKVLSEVKEPYREALLLRFIEAMPPRDIASRLGVPVETVRTRVKRGIAQMRADLDAAHDGNRQAWRSVLAPVAAVSQPSAALAVPAVMVLGALLLLLGLLGAFVVSESEGPADENRVDHTAGGEMPVATIEMRSAELPEALRSDREALASALAPASSTSETPGTSVTPAARLAAPDDAVAGEDVPVRDADELRAGAPVAERPAPKRSKDEVARGVFRYSDNGHPTLDPAHASTRNDERLILALLECLTTLDPETGRARPGAATDWRVSGCGNLWYFNLRKDAVWSDGSAVTAADFVRGWRRVMDPFTFSPWSSLFRPIKDCEAIYEQSRRAMSLSAFRAALRELRAEHTDGIPGDVLNRALDETGVRAALAKEKARTLQSLIRWKNEDVYPGASSAAVLKHLLAARRVAKDGWEDKFDGLGRGASGIVAAGDHMLLVMTEGYVPYLPELVARPAFAPIHRSIEKLRGRAFEAGSYVGNGPFVLAGRGPKPPPGSRAARVTSVVELERNEEYTGPNRARVERIVCKVDLSLRRPAEEDLREFDARGLDLVNGTWPQRPSLDLLRALRDMDGYRVRATPRLLYLRFRCDRAPFLGKDARRAFALAVHREASVARCWPGGTPATRVVPPGIRGRTEGVHGPAGTARDAEAAFKQAGLDRGTWVELTHGEDACRLEVGASLLRTWKEILGVDAGRVVHERADAHQRLREGRSSVMLDELCGAVNDPLAYLELFHSDHGDHGSGWSDPIYDALIDAARDPDVATRAPERWLATVADSTFKELLTAARHDNRDALERFRGAVLAAAEQRLLDEYVVVPLLFLNEATLTRDVRGLGSATARRNPAFVGSLADVVVPPHR